MLPHLIILWLDILGILQQILLLLGKKVLVEFRVFLDGELHIRLLVINGHLSLLLFEFFELLEAKFRLPLLLLNQFLLKLFSFVNLLTILLPLQAHGHPVVACLNLFKYGRIQRLHFLFER